MSSELKEGAKSEGCIFSLWFCFCACFEFSGRSTLCVCAVVINRERSNEEHLVSIEQV